MGKRLKALGHPAHLKELRSEGSGAQDGENIKTFLFKLSLNILFKFQII